jgi:hypothetical protein
LIGDRAPAFTAESTHGPISLADYAGRWLILFSHPADFTPICTTEFVAFTELAGEFAARNAALLGNSVDSVHSHLAFSDGFPGRKGTTGVMAPVSHSPINSGTALTPPCAGRPTTWATRARIVNGLPQVRRSGGRSGRVVRPGRAHLPVTVQPRLGR